jgi:hypothetical protein
VVLAEMFSRTFQQSCCQARYVVHLP